MNGVLPGQRELVFYRLKISDRKPERVLTLVHPPALQWVGLAPDDSLLELRINAEEIYALDWQAP